MAVLGMDNDVDGQTFGKAKEISGTRKNSYAKMGPA
jgi:hypothetical protein